MSDATIFSADPVIDKTSDNCRATEKTVGADGSGDDDAGADNGGAERKRIFDLHIFKNYS